MYELQQIHFTILLLLYVGIFSLRTLLIAGGMTWVISKSRFASLRRVYRLAFGKDQVKSELRAAGVVIAFDALVLALSVRSGWVQPSETTLASFALTFAAMFVWFEVWFYVTHRLMHTKPLYFLHAQHHVAKVTHPLTSLSFSIGERAILQLGSIGFAALASRVMPLALPGLIAYFLFNYVANVIGHSNVEWMPARFPATRLGKTLISVSFHAMHHARHRGHYGLFTQLLDRAFGSYFSDYPKVHERAATGRGLSRLSERLAPGRAADRHVLPGR